MTKVAVVTGANRGVGLGLVKELSERGWHVVAACRQTSDELQQVGDQSTSVEVVTGVDIGTDDGCKALAELKHKKIDLIINNAGRWGAGGLADLNLDDIRLCFEVNALGPLRTFKALEGKLEAGSKIVVIGSLMGSCANCDNTGGGRYPYRLSKSAGHIAAVTMASDLRERGIPVGLVHPGVVITRMTELSGSNAKTTTQESAQGIVDRAEQLSMANTGRYWDFRGFVLPF